MKSFNAYLTEAPEEFPVAHRSDDGAHETLVTKHLNNPETRSEINVFLLQATAGEWSNPHGALNRVAKVLATYGILLPRVYMPDVSGGELVYGITPHGTLHDYNNSVPTEDSQVPDHYVYFEYGLSDSGTFICYAEIVDLDELEGLMEDIDEDDETLDEAKKTAFVPDKAYNHLKDYKHKHVPGLYHFDHFEHPSGHFIQVRHPNHSSDFNAVHSDKNTGVMRHFDSRHDLKMHVRQVHGDSGNRPGKYHKENLDEGLKLLKTYTSENGLHHAKVYKDSEWGEHRVKFFKNGVHQKNADHHTDDAADAHGTAQIQLKHMNEDLDDLEDLDEGYKIGDKVNATNHKATPRYTILAKTKTHYQLSHHDSNEPKGWFAKERIARVNKAAHAYRQGKPGLDPRSMPHNVKKDKEGPGRHILNRGKGAPSKNEDLDNDLQELSRKTLSNYITKAHVSGTAAASNAERSYANIGRIGRKNKEQVDKSKAWRDLRSNNLDGENRERGINRAAKRLARD